jgi:heme-degrading monooxygenase HmoA
MPVHEGGAEAMSGDQRYVWITTRRLKPGAREEFRKAWRPSEFPVGMLNAFEYDAIGSDEVVGITVWDSPESREQYRLSEVEAQRQRAMAPLVLETTSGFYVGRELKIPGR